MNLKSQTVKKKTYFPLMLRKGPLENLSGAGEVQKKHLQGKIKRKKIHARQLTLKNIHAMA